LKKQFRGFAERGTFPNLLLYGPPGISKTTTAMTLCNAVNADVYRVGASKDRGIEMVRKDIVDFASTYAFSGGGKVVVLEDADRLTIEAQGALLPVMEDYAANCGFILTCNDPEKIIPALRSRCTNVDFTPRPGELGQLRAECHRRMCQILDLEGVEYDPDTVAEIVDRHFPDFRRVINDLQALAARGLIGDRVAGMIVAPNAPEMVPLGNGGPAAALTVNGEKQLEDTAASTLDAEKRGDRPPARVASVTHPAEPQRKAGGGAAEQPEPPRPLTRELPPPDPFPVEALGKLLEPAARAIQDRVRAPLAICGQSVLAAATLAVQGDANVALPMGQSKPLSSFFVSVAATGERKNAVDQEALHPVRQREASLGEAYAGQLLEYHNAGVAWAAGRRAAIKNAAGDRTQTMAALAALGPPPLPPLEPLLTCEEPTFEGLCTVLATGSPSVGIFAAEGAQFVGGHGMAAAKLRTAAGLSAVWDGGPLKRVRARNGVSVLAGRRVTVHLMVQPDVAAIWFGDRLLVEQGLMSRVLVTAPEAESGRRIWREPSPDSGEAMNSYNERLRDILERPLPLAAGTRNELTPRTLPLSPAARRLWIDYHDHVERRLGLGSELEPVRGLANKLPEHAARIAAVLTLVENIEAGEVGSNEMAAGIAIARHYAAEALRLLGASRVSAELCEAQQALTWLQTSWPHPLVSLPDIYQRGPNSIRDTRRARRVVGILEDHGHLVRLPDGDFVDGTFRREVWEIVRG
jgi:DNA polymerase III delta prime subunit